MSRAEREAKSRFASNFSVDPIATGRLTCILGF